jgi:hypothetical protein
LRSGRERKRKRKENGKKVGGRKSHVELWPEVVAEARRLRGGRKAKRPPELPEIGAKLKDAGYRNERGEPFTQQRFEQ